MLVRRKLDVDLIQCFIIQNKHREGNVTCRTRYACVLDMVLFMENN